MIIITPRPQRLDGAKNKVYYYTGLKDTVSSAKKKKKKEERRGKNNLYMHEVQNNNSMDDTVKL